VSIILGCAVTTTLYAVFHNYLMRWSAIARDYFFDFPVILFH